MTTTYFRLADGSFQQDWDDSGLIAANDVWSGVPSIVGYRGDGLTSATGADPRTITGTSDVLDVNANQTNPNTFSTGGVAEFTIANPAVALTGSGTADAPYLVLHLDATGQQNVTLTFNARDIDASADDAVQQLAVQYRIGEAGAWANVPGGYLPDATTGGAATAATPVSVILPEDSADQPQLQVRILTTNAAGNDEWIGIDDIRVASTSLASDATTDVSVSDAVVDEGDGVATFTVTRSDDASAFTVDYTTAAGSAASGSDFVPESGSLSFQAGGALTQTITVTINDDATTEPDETFSVVLSNLIATSGLAGVKDSLGTGTIRNDDVQVTRVSEVQGSDTASPLVGQTVTVEAIVVGDFQNGDADPRRNLGGFYLQEEQADWDTSALTSEGLFVYEGPAAFRADVSEGDRVRVTGKVSEFNGETQFSVANAAGIQVVTPAAVADVGALAAVLNLPAASSTGSVTAGFQPNLEALEGMLVTIPQTLTVTEQFNLDRFNEIKLFAAESNQLAGAIDESIGNRPYQFTQTNNPDPAGYVAHLQAVGEHTITYDDGLNTQNQPIENLDGFDPDDDGVGPNPSNPAEPGYGTATAPRMGDMVTGLTGVLGFGPASAYRVRAIDDGDNTFVATNLRPSEPEDVGGTLQVGSFNVLNYFTTLNAGSNMTANGFEPRGANSQTEFERQTDKLVASILELDADVLGLVEIENNFIEGSPGNAIDYLVDALNAAAGEVRYDWVRPEESFVGGDAIAVGFIYKPSEVRIAPNTSIEILDDADVRPELLLQSTVGGIFNGPNTSRAALAVTFEEIVSGEPFTVVANHLKSKGGNGTGEDADQQDGAGAWNNQRELAAQALTEWLAGSPTGTDDGDTLLLGDFNSYFQENPIDVLKTAGYENLQERIEDPYSYVFDGQIGSLDYILANGSLSTQVTGITEWHINADEADALDYNLDFSRAPDYFDGAVVARVSDHDPLLVGLELAGNSTPRLIAGTNKADVFTDDAGFATTYRAGNGDDVVYGLNGADELFGGNEQDQLFGGTGADRLSGENGDDQLAGGAGADVFVFTRGGGDDTVLDFSFESGDRLQLSGEMRLTGVRTIDDGVSEADAIELSFNGATVTLLGISGVTDVDALFV
jgi:predicted extracellular nuclease